MGKPGAKLTKQATEASENLVRVLESIGAIASRKMFGGYGVFHEGKMFALVSSDGSVFFKVSEQNLPQFQAAGAEKFGKMPYYSLPIPVSRDGRKLIAWARKAIAVAHQA